MNCHRAVVLSGEALTSVMGYEGHLTRTGFPAILIELAAEIIYETLFINPQRISSA